MQQQWAPSCYSQTAQDDHPSKPKVKLRHWIGAGPNVPHEANDPSAKIIPNESTSSKP